MIGSQLGQYQIIEQIGAGAQASVYRAYQPTMERYVAVKVLPRHFASDPTFVQRFYQEARLIARLEHAHILPVYDFGEDRGIAYLAMRYLEAGTLKDIMIERTLPLPEVTHLICQIASALDYAHRQGVVHRDVKPANIMIDREGNSYLTDFGVAKIVEGTGGLTASGTIGTPAYMSPEQGMTGRIDGRSDVYALGVLLYQLVTNTLPYDADTAMAVILQHINEPVPSASSKFPHVSYALERVIQTAMAKAPEERYQTGDEMCEALRQSAGVAATQVTPNELRAGAEIAIETMVAKRAELVEQAPVLAPPPQQTMDRGPRRTLLYGLLGLIGVAAVAVIVGMIVAGVFSGPSGAEDAEGALTDQLAALATAVVPDGQSTAVSVPEQATPGDETTPTIAEDVPPPTGEVPFVADMEGPDPLAQWAVSGDWHVMGDFNDFSGGQIPTGNHVLFSEARGSSLSVLGLLQPAPDWVASENYFITMRVKLRRSGAAARLLFSESGSSDFYALDFSTSNVSLKRFEGGSDTLPPESTGIPLELGRWYDLWVWRHGQHVAVYVNGQWFLQSLDLPALPPGTIGLETIGEGGVMVDDLTVSATHPSSEDFEGVSLPATWNVVSGVTLDSGDASQVLVGANLGTDQVGPIMEEDLGDFTFSCRVQAQQGTNGLQFRKGSGGYYDLVFESGHVALDRIVNRGQDVRLVEARNVYGPSSVRTVVVQALGEHITVSFDGQPLIDLDDPGGQAAGVIAVRYDEVSSLSLDDCVIFTSEQPSNVDARFVYDLWESMFNVLGSTAAPAIVDDFSEQCAECWVAPPGTPANGPGTYTAGGYTITAADSELWWLFSDAPTFLESYVSTAAVPTTNFIGLVDVKVAPSESGGESSGWVGVRAQPDRTGVILEQIRVRLTTGPDGNVVAVESAGSVSQEVLYSVPWPNYDAVGADGWHQVMVVAQGDRLAFFVNGTFLTTVRVGGDDRTEGTLSIGALPDSTASFDNVSLWDVRGLGTPERFYRK
jgi:tRNA A-37 threonylcarbamoyl transferase component Bud32